jgi:hypothetical protein
MIEKKLFYEIKKNADFHSVVMTTFSFDFHHFEAQVFKQIKQKGITNVCLFVDEKMLDESIGFATGNLKSLNSSYSVNGISSKGVFHPKIALFVGEKEIMLLQGSGNITSGGHGKNHELFSVLYATTADITQLPLIIETWNYIKDSTKNIKGFSQEKLSWIENNAPLLSKLKSKNHSFHKLSDNIEAALLYNEKTGIFNQLTALIPNQEITKIRVVSPFYDENGALLLSLSKTFNDCSIEAYLQDKKGIHPHKMEKQKNISFYSWDATERASKTFKKYERKLHAKLFVFESVDWHYCLLGSPNASIAAFGQENYSGANDEFGVLYKYKKEDFVKELGIFGGKQKVNPTKPNEIELQNEVEKATTKVKKIKILGADKDGRNLSLFLHNFESHTKVIIKLYDNWGTVLEEQTILKLSEKLKLEVNKSTPINAVMYLQLFDENGLQISNKHLLNNVADLWNTNPSPENRRLMRLTSMIEAGEYKLFEVMEYFNTLHSNRTSNTNSTIRKSGYSEKEENNSKNIDAVLTYEEAIAFDATSKSHQLLLKQHHSIKIWDSFEKYLKEYASAFEEDTMDDEEEADATSSRDRKEVTNDNRQEYFSSFNVLEKRRNIIYKFLFNYLTALIKIEEIKNKKLGLVDLAMLLIVLEQLFEVTQRKFTLSSCENKKDNAPNYIYEINGNLSEIGSFAGAILNIVGQFINIGLHSKWEEPMDEYGLKKLNHYKHISCIRLLFSLATIKINYNNDVRFNDWFDVSAFNILTIFGNPDDNFESEIETLINNSNIENISNLEINSTIKQWIKENNKNQLPTNYFHSEITGICIIRKTIPNQDNPKFLKLSRPGFDFNLSEHDFVSDELYHIESEKWFRTKKSLHDEL